MLVEAAFSNCFTALKQQLTGHEIFGRHQRPIFVDVGQRDEIAGRQARTSGNKTRSLLFVEMTFRGQFTSALSGCAVTGLRRQRRRSVLVGTLWEVFGCSVSRRLCRVCIRQRN